MPPVSGETVPVTQKRSSVERSSSYSKKLWTVTTAVVAVFVACVAPHSKEHPAVMGAVAVLLCLLLVVGIEQIDSEEPYLSMLQWFVQLIGALAIVLLCSILKLWVAMIASIILGLFVMGALIRSYSKIKQAPVDLLAATLTLARLKCEDAWSQLCNIVQRRSQVFSRTNHSQDVDGNGSSSVQSEMTTEA